jgi:AcrR family transcriptional regulator
MPVLKLTPERRRELTRTALIESAAEVFAERGLHAASLDEIAARAGFTRGAIYSNFGSKDELLLAVLDWHNRRSLEAFTEISSREDWDAAAGARAWAQVVHGDPSLALLQVEFRLHALRDPEFRQRLAETHRTHVERIARFVEDSLLGRGVFLKIPATDFAEIGWAASDGLLLFASVDRENAARYDRLIELLYQAAFGAWLETATPEQP